MSESLTHHITPITSALQRIGDVLPSSTPSPVTTPAQPTPEQVSSVADALETVKQVEDRRQHPLWERVLQRALPSAAVGGFGIGAKAGLLGHAAGNDPRAAEGSALKGLAIGGGIGLGTGASLELADTVLDPKRLMRAKRILRAAPAGIQRRLADPETQQAAQQYEQVKDTPVRWGELGALLGGTTGSLTGVMNAPHVTGEAPLPTNQLGIQMSPSQLRSGGKMGLIGLGVGGAIGVLSALLYRNQYRNRLKQQLAKRAWVQKTASITTTPWVTLPDGTDVRLVDGVQVRNDGHTDYIGGGHHLVYDWIPENEIWIDTEVPELDRAFILSHELTERGLMRSGVSYDDAHDAANAFEGKLRQHANHQMKTSANKTEEPVGWPETNAPRNPQPTGGNPRKASNRILTRGLAGVPTRYSGGRHGVVKAAEQDTDETPDSDQSNSDHPHLRSRSEVVIYSKDGIIGFRKPGYLLMPGGGIDDGEEPEFAAYRESIEEADRKLLHIKPMGVVEAIWPEDKKLVDGFDGERTYFFLALDGGSLGTEHADNEPFATIPFKEAKSFLRGCMSDQDNKWAEKPNQTRLQAIEEAEKAANNGFTTAVKLALAGEKLAATHWAGVISSLKGPATGPIQDGENPKAGDNSGAGDEVQPGDIAKTVKPEKRQTAVTPVDHEAALHGYEHAPQVPSPNAHGGNNPQLAKTAVDDGDPAGSPAEEACPMLAMKPAEEPDDQGDFPAILLDMDSTVRQWRNGRYDTLGDQFIMPNRIETLDPLKQMGCRIIGVTNHTCRGDRDDHSSLTPDLLGDLQRETIGLMGGTLDDICYTPAPHPDVLKPAPTMIVHVMKRFGLDPAKCVMVGDNLDHDGGAADAAGIPFCEAQHFFSDPAHTVETVQQMLGLPGQTKQADRVTTAPRSEYVMFDPENRVYVAPDQNRRYRFPTSGVGAKAPYEPTLRYLPPNGADEPGVHGYDVTLNVGDVDPAAAPLFEGGVWAPPEEVLKNMYGSMGLKQNAGYRDLDRARARVILNYLKRKRKAQPVVSVAAQPVQPTTEPLGMPKISSLVKVAAQMGAPAKKKNTWDKGERRALMGAGALGLTGLGAVGAGEVFLTPKDNAVLNEFSEQARKWNTGEVGLDEPAKGYAIEGSKAMRIHPLGVPMEKAMHWIREIPGVPPQARWNAGSAQHYHEFANGPLAGYLQRMKEYAYPSGDPNVDYPRTQIFTAIKTKPGASAQFGADDVIHPDMVAFNAQPGYTGSDSNPDLLGKNVKTFAKMLANLQAAGVKPENVSHFNPDRFITQLRGAAEAVGASEGLRGDYHTWSPDQQTNVLKHLDPWLSKHNPTTYGQSQLMNSVVGLNAQNTSAGLYNTAIQTGQHIRNNLIGGGAVLGAGAVGLLGYLLYKHYHKKPTK
jgi:histidinol phosphatase-like enzyme